MAVQLGLQFFDRDDRADGYDLLNVTAKITVENGEKIAYADCMLDARRIPIAALGNTAAQLATG